MHSRLSNSMHELIQVLMQTLFRESVWYYRWRIRWEPLMRCGAGMASSTPAWFSSPASTSQSASSVISSTATRWRGASRSICQWMNCELATWNLRNRSLKFLFSLAILVKIMMSLAIFFSYALQFYVPVELLNPFIQRRYALNYWLSKATSIALSDDFAECLLKII